ncbi:MAG: hypothetical protein ABEK59_05750 [Halobacteria archaeon]
MVLLDEIDCEECNDIVMVNIQQAARTLENCDDNKISNRSEALRTVREEVNSQLEFWEDEEKVKDFPEPRDKRSLISNISNRIRSHLSDHTKENKQ